MIIAWGVSTLFGPCAQGIEEGRTRCCQSAISEQCLRNPNQDIGRLVFVSSQSFVVSNHLRPGATLRA